MGLTIPCIMYSIQTESFAPFLSTFFVLFVLTGIGNGATYRMIPAIFRAEKLREAEGSSETAKALAVKAAAIESAAALGFIGAIGACGGYLIPFGFGAAIASSGGPYLAL